MVYTKRDFLKYIGSLSILSVFGVNRSIKSQNSNLIKGVIEDDVYRNNRRRSFKITSESSQIKTFSCSSISFKRYLIRFETLTGFTGEKVLWIEEEKDLTVGSELYTIIDSESCTGTTTIIDFRLEKEKQTENQNTTGENISNKTNISDNQQNISNNSYITENKTNKTESNITQTNNNNSDIYNNTTNITNQNQSERKQNGFNFIIGTITLFILFLFRVFKKHNKK